MRIILQIYFDIEEFIVPQILLNKNIKNKLIWNYMVIEEEISNDGNISKINKKQYDPLERKDVE